MKGRFITFEGGEGAGKSTQLEILHQHLIAQGFNVIRTREPGGVESSEKLRKLLLSQTNDDWDPISELLLHFAARREHLEKLIKPALNQGSWVLCDRFIDSTIAYQGYGNGIDISFIRDLHISIQQNIYPDLTLIFDLPPEVGLSRVEQRGTRDRYELMDLAFHAKLRNGFRTIGELEPDRCVIINAEKNIDEIKAEILEVLKKKFSELGV